MSEAVTTIQVFERDAAKLAHTYGKPMKRALRLVLDGPCKHPETKRIYTTALIRPDGQEFSAAADDMKTISGFRCMACHSYVFPEPKPSDEQSRS